MTDTLPPDIALNAWAGSSARSDLAPRADRWGARRGLPTSQQALDLGKPPNPLDWTSLDVGYGVLLAESAADDRTQALGLDAPEAVQELMKARPGTVMLRWREELDTRYIRRYFPNGPWQEPKVGLSVFGTGVGQLPRYVTIIGGPDQIPWSVQYAFETRHAVGRLPLDDAGLANYIEALLSGFPQQDVDMRAPLMWTVSHAGDITAEMRAVISTPLEAALTDPHLPRFEHLVDDSATAAELIARLTAARPALVVTSSHGFAEGSKDVLRKGLGLPVDRSHAAVALANLIAAMPSGAVWYSQACCSAGSDGLSKYGGLLAPGPVLDIVENVAALGSTVAPAVLALLGGEKPIRGFLGHVEPTFDWTLRDAETGQGLGGLIVKGISTNLYAGQPLGYALNEYRAGVGVLHGDWQHLNDRLNNADTTVREALTRTRLTALDRQSLVLLGDPTATLPDLASAP